MSLTEKQRKLLDLIDYRVRHRMPTVQRDLAEALGIRRDSLNKLLARTRLALGGQRDLTMPPRSRSSAAPLVSFSDR